jgi:hypothetical protein
MEPAETVEENCGCVRLEWVNRWPTLCELHGDDDDSQRLYYNYEVVEVLRLWWETGWRV